MTKYYHCTPKEFYSQPEHIIQMHIEFIRLENREEVKEQKRAEQEANKQQSLNK